MNTEQEENKGSLLSSQEPHQREEMDQAEKASRASYTLEPEKGMTEEPGTYNQGDEQVNIKQSQNHQTDPIQQFDPVSDVDLDAGENDLTNDDLQALGGLDRDENTTM